MKKRHLLMAAGFLAASITAAVAVGNWSTLPIVGEASFCASNVSGTTLPSTQGPYGVVPGSTFGTGSSICGQTVPAGPTALTGNELVPADTTLANGQPPATVTVPMPLVASGAYYDNTGVNNAGINLGAYLTTATVPNNINTFIMDVTNTITSLSLTFPSTPLNGQILRVASVKTITNFTPVANTTVNASQTITGTLPTALTPSATAAVGYAWIYNGTTSAWERLQ